MQTSTSFPLKNVTSGARFDDSIHQQHALQLIPQFESGLRDIYWLQLVLVKALPKMIWCTRADELTSHLVSFAQTAPLHVERLESIFRMLRKKAAATKSIAADTLIREAVGDLDATNNGFLRDAKIIFALQRIFHYEIAAYGRFYQMAERLGLHEVADLLHTCLEEVVSASERMKEVSIAISYYRSENVPG